jgi:hypothetical protein
MRWKGNIGIKEAGDRSIPPNFSKGMDLPPLFGRGNAPWTTVMMKKPREMN